MQWQNLRPNPSLLPLDSMVKGVVEFSSGGYKIKKILRIGVLGRCQKVPIFDFSSQFSSSKNISFLFIENTNIRAESNKKRVDN